MRRRKEAAISKENSPRKEEGTHPARGKGDLFYKRETNTKVNKIWKDLQEQYKQGVSVLLFSWVRL